MKWFYILFLLLVNYSLLFAVQLSDLESIWEKGKKAERDGSYEQALTIWETAFSDSIDTNLSDTDPRIGFDYMSLVTQRNLTDHYRKASDYYFLSITKGCQDKHRKILALELERLAPIMNTKNYDRLKNTLKKNLTSFCNQLVSFWEKMDPTFSDGFNERLIEHWERIAHAKEQFQRSKNTVYQTDDRGLIYVRLGEPNQKKNGTMQFNYGLVRAWIQDIIDAQQHSGISQGSFGGDSAGNAGSIFTAQNGQYLQVEELARNALLSLKYPYYEIWVYRDLNESKHNNLIYIFGEDGDDGSFGLRNSLDDMIPNSAFRRGSNKGLVTPGLIHQLLFYEQTSQIDTYFEEAYHDLESRILSMNGLNRKTSRIVKDQNRNILSSKQFSAPEQETSIYDEVSQIELDSHQYRFLNIKNQPYLATYISSRPQTSLYLDQVKEKTFTTSNYKLIYYLATITDENEIIDLQQQNSRIYLDQLGSTNDMRKSYAYFETPNIADGIQQSIKAELHNTEMESISVSDKIVLNNIRALGKTAKIQPEPLSTKQTELELSDILLGQMLMDADSASRGLANFTVVHDRKIPEQTDLMVHFQIYHLSLQNQDMSKFEVEYRVSKKQKGFFKKLFGSNNEASLTLNFESLESYSINNLEIDTRAFDPGNYELSLKIIEPVTNREVSRTVSFEITEIENG